MFTAFQPNAFQTNAYQIVQGVAPPAPPISVPIPDNNYGYYDRLKEALRREKENKRRLREAKLEADRRQRLIDEANKRAQTQLEAMRLEALKRQFEVDLARVLELELIQLQLREQIAFFKREEEEMMVLMLAMPYL